MSSVIPAARVKFGMYPVFPAAVFRVCEKIRSENRFSATSASYFRLHLCVNIFYFICLFRVCIVDYFAFLFVLSAFQKLAIHISSALFTCCRKHLEIAIFPRLHFRTSVSGHSAHFFSTFFYITKNCTKFQKTVAQRAFCRFSFQ